MVLQEHIRMRQYEVSLRLSRYTSHLAHQCGPVIDEAASRPMQGLNVLLLF